MTAWSYRSRQATGEVLPIPIRNEGSKVSPITADTGNGLNDRQDGGWVCSIAMKRGNSCGAKAPC